MPVLRVLFLTLLSVTVKVASPQTLQDEVKYGARDSMRYDMASQKVYLFGAATVKYQDMELTADRILLDLGREEVQAYGSTDSSGAAVGRPKFTQAGQEVEADSIRYNFKTKEGIIKEVRTAESQLYALAHQSKRHPNGEIHSRGGSLTTCDRPHPHYRFAVSRMMVIPEDKIVMGPAVMKIGKVPTPLAAPFGFFPNHKNRGAAGLLIPTWGTSDQFGMFLLNGGYYIPMGDHLDEQLTADIYSKGSWGLRSVTRYRSRYRFSGNLDLQYTNKLNSLREYPDFSEQRTFFVRWNHLMDAKASLTDRFSASVNVGSSQNFTNNFNSSTNDYLSNTFQSNINWSHLWSGKPYSLSVAARHSQNTLNRSFDVTLPSVNFIVQRFFPGTWLHPAGLKQKWYDRIGITWNSVFENRLRTTEDQISIENMPRLMDRMRNGVRHTASVSTSIKSRAFTLNPQLNITDRMYFDALRKTYLPDEGIVAADTVPGLHNLFDWNIGATATSKLYGMFAFHRGRLEAIRHTLTPSASLTYVPAHDTRIQGPFGPGGSTASYSPYEIGIYGQPAVQASGLVSLGLVQSVEGKVLSRKKTDERGDPLVNKVKFLDFLGINTNYDLLKDSINWSPVSVAARTRLFDRLDLNLSSNWDTYATDSLGRSIELPTRKLDGSLAHLRNATAAVGIEFQSKRYGKVAGGDTGGDPVVADVDPGKGARINFSIPWHLRVNYSWSMARSYRAQAFTEQQTQGVLFNGDINILKWWKLGFSSGYDMEAKEWTPTSINLYWDLHCWEFNANLIPIGIRKSFTFRINVKASVLHDLKYELRRPFGNRNELLY